MKLYRVHACFANTQKLLRSALSSSSNCAGFSSCFSVPCSVSLAIENWPLCACVRWFSGLVLMDHSPGESTSLCLPWAGSPSNPGDIVASPCPRAHALQAGWGQVRNNGSASFKSGCGLRTGESGGGNDTELPVRVKSTAGRGKGWQREVVLECAPLAPPAAGRGRSRRCGPHPPDGEAACLCGPQPSCEAASQAARDTCAHHARESAHCSCWGGHQREYPGLDDSHKHEARGGVWHVKCHAVW